MRGGIIGSICFLAVLMSVGRTEDPEKSSLEDLNSVVPESTSVATVSSEDEESRSGAMAESSAVSDGGSAQSEAKADSSGRSSIAQSSALAGSGGSAVSRAQASSVAQSETMGLGMSGSPLRMHPALPYVPVPSSDQFYPINQGSVYQDDINARPSSGRYNPSNLMVNPYNSRVNQYDPRVNSYNVGLNPYPQQSPYSKSNSASAKAEALANSGGSSPYNPGQNLYDLYSQFGSQVPMNSGSSSASAQAEAYAKSGGNRYPLDPYSTVPLSQDSIAQAVAEVSAEERPSGYLPIGGQSSSDAQAQALGQASSKTAASDLVNAFADTYSRMMMPDEYIYPNKMRGGKVITCSREHEFYYLRTSQLQCLVCVCVEEYNRLSPVCVSCSGCMAERNRPDPPSPPELITISPEPYTVAPTPRSLTHEVTCRPLPSGKPFTNPLNPCQVCICQESLNFLGRPDVQIDCQESPQCVIPPDVTTMIPDVHVPVPQPLCEKFPANVLFPHPTEMCKICRCSVGMSEYGRPEQAITCFPNPDCVPRPPHHTTPRPFPDIVTVVPWPPTPTTPAPLPRGPLPGPSPHASCRPFQPKQPFQHPWDDCQVCVCTEAYAIGLITVEVNCFTKPSCCVEPPEQFGPMTLPSPPTYPYIPDQLCEFKSFDVEFVHPDDRCQVCACVLTNGIVTSMCRTLPNCSVLYPGVSSSASASAEAIANSNNVQVPSGGGDMMPSSVFPYVSGETGGVSGGGGYYPEQYQPGGMRGLYPGGGMSSASAEALAQTAGQGNAQANAQAEALSNIESGYKQNYPGNMNMDYMYPGTMNMDIMYPNKLNMDNMYPNTMNMDYMYPNIMNMDNIYTNQMNMDNMYTNKMNMDNMYPNLLNMDNMYTNKMNMDNMYPRKMNLDGMYLNKMNMDNMNPGYINMVNMNNKDMYPGQMNLDMYPANMNMDNTYPSNMNIDNNMYPVNGGYGGHSGIASDGAKAQALMNGIASGYADAKSQALSDVLSGFSSKFNPFNNKAVPSSAMFPGLYTRPSKNITPLYMPRSNVEPSSSSAQASAQSVASGSNGPSQATATAIATAGSNKHLAKSGNSESEEEV